MSDDDPVHRRAAEIRAEGEAAERDAERRESDLREERVRLVQRFIDALSEKTPHSVQCMADVEGAHAAVAQFGFIKDGKAWTQHMFEFGMDRVDGEPGNRNFSYYLQPSVGGFAIPNPRTGVARALKGASADDVVEYAVAIAIEMMARTVATGGMLGSPAEIEAQFDLQKRQDDRRARTKRAEQGRRFWAGCAKAVIWFFGIVIGIGLLGNIMRACSGG